MMRFKKKITDSRKKIWISGASPVVLDLEYCDKEYRFHEFREWFGPNETEKGLRPTLKIKHSDKPLQTFAEQIIAVITAIITTVTSLFGFNSQPPE